MIVKIQILVVRELEVMFFAHVACRGYEHTELKGRKRSIIPFFLGVLLVLF